MSAAPAHRLAALQSSAWSHWTTPPAILDLVRHLGPIALDPCGNETSLRLVDAGVTLLGPRRPPAYSSHPGRWTAHTGNGLGAPWSGCGGLIYANPPYGDAIARWTEKMAVEGGRGAEIVALVPARTDTAWFQDHVFRQATAGCFVRGRLSFGNPPPDKPTEAPAGFPSFLAYWGKQVERFFDVFDSLGELARLNTARRRRRSQ